MKKSVVFLMAIVAASSAATIQAEPSPIATTTALDRYHVPSSLSPQAQAGLKQLYDVQRAVSAPTRPTTLADWDAQNAAANAAVEPISAQYMQILKATATEDRIGGVPVILVKPANYKPGSAPLVYVHGGGWVTLSANTLRGDTALFANATGREIISIEYTLAPRGNWQSITDQVISVWKALLAQGYKPGAMGMTGGSAGGNLILASTLKMRDQGLPLPGALYAISPATDLTFGDDTSYTLAALDPTLDSRTLPWLVEAYVGQSDPKHPYISPVYGDYSKPFPPTIIQVGTREQLLSNAVRQYQAIRSGGHEAVLDVYEGMPHSFPAIVAFTPEGQTALARAAAFFERHLMLR
jgi:epsilon-lactone hydrolase